MRLYGVKDSARTQKVLVTAEYVSVKVDFPPFVPGKDDKTADFKKKSPLGRTPVLETPKGCIVGSAAIIRYLGRLRGDVGLYGESFHQQAEVDMWLEFGQNELEVPLAAWVYPSLGVIAANEDATARAKEDVKAVLRTLNDLLLDNTFLVGETVTLADISLCISLAEGYRTVFDQSFFKDFPNVNRWFYTCINQRPVAKVLGSIRPLPQVAGAPSTAAAQGADDDEDAPLPPKKKNVLDDLPPTTMNFDEFKRVYSNTKELESVAMKWFWENFDPTGYAIFFVEYQKLATECTVDFVTANLLNGFMQRFEGTFRKYSFAVMDVIGKDKCFDIKGVWMFRGQSIPEEMREHPSFDYYTFKQLSHNKPEDRKRITDYWCSLENVDGLPVVDRKVWK